MRFKGKIDLPRGTKVLVTRLPEDAVVSAPTAAALGLEAGLILSLDVSSTASGYALFNHGKLESFGLVQPNGDALARIDFTADAIAKIAQDRQPGLIVMEWSNGLTHGAIGKARGLSVLGAAQGAVRERLRAMATVRTVDQNLWTNSRPKAERTAIIRLIYPEYARWAGPNGKADSGSDTADAVGLGDWWLVNAVLKK